MPFTTGIQDRGIDANSIIAYAKREVPAVEANLHVDRRCSRMQKRVGHRLDSDSLGLLANHRLKFPRLPYHRDADLRRVRLRIVGDAEEYL